MNYGDQAAITLLLGLLLQASCAFSQTADEEDLALVYGDATTVSIATGSEQPLRKAPAVATVITAEEIAAMGAADLDEVLQTVPGIHVSRNASLYSPLYVVRGIYSPFNPQTLVLENGIPMTTLFVGNKGNVWGGYPLEHVERIEIIRGPGSALYGADAFAGVINIVTKTAADTPGTRVGSRIGSFATRSAWVQHGGTVGPIEIAAFLHAGHTDGFRKTIEADAQTVYDREAGTDASLAPGPVNTDYDAIDAHLDLGLDKWRLRAGYKLRDDLGTGAGVSSALDPVGKMKSERINADLNWADPQLADYWGGGATLSYLYYTQQLASNLQLLPPGATFPTGSFPDGMIGAPQTWERQLRLSAFLTYTGIERHRFRFGAGYDDLHLYRTEEYKNFVFDPDGVPVPAGPVDLYTGSQAFMEPQRRRVKYLYIQDEWQFASDWGLTAGLRRDHYSEFGHTTNPRVALVWDAAHDLTLKLLYGHAFRAPSFNEEYSINNPVVRGNPDLRPETIRTVEAALAWHPQDNFRANLNVFRYEMDHIIRTVPNPLPETGETYANTGGQNGHGLELDLAWDATSRLRLSGNYAYQAATDDATGLDAGYIPRHQAYLRADWRIASGWALSPQLHWSADRRRPPGDTRPMLDDYTTFDLTVRSTGTRSPWSFALTVRNLFNADVREPSQAPGLLLPNDLPLAGRALYLQAEYKM